MEHQLGITIKFQEFARRINLFTVVVFISVKEQEKRDYLTTLQYCKCSENPCIADPKYQVGIVYT